MGYQEEEGFVFKSTVETCTYCGESVAVTGRSSSVVLYGRNGPREIPQIEKRCKNRECLVGYWAGYHIYKGQLLYDEGALANDHLIVSRNTAFEVLFLYEAVMQTFFGNVCFRAVCEIYNAVHYSAIGKDTDRFELCYKRIIRAFFTYALIDLSTRYGFTLKFDPQDIDVSIANHFEELHNLINMKWKDHKCEVPGCRSVLVIDGGLKPQRKVCAARTAAIFQHKHSGVETLIGCTTIPVPGEQFCSLHLKAEVPSVPFQKLSKENVSTLRRTRQQVKTEKIEEDVFTVKSIQKKKSSKNGPLFLIQWQGYEVMTWEPEENIPGWIIKYFEKNGSADIPRPRIKSTKKVGSGLYYLLSWDKTDAPDYYVSENDFVISPEEEAKMISCNTKKSHGARFCKTSAGIMVGAYPCGTIPLFDELYGVESVSQVYGILTDWIGETKPEHLSYILYDDACHLAPYGKEKSRASYSSATKTLSDLKFYVDKFHFKGHVSKTCHENYNPYSCKDLAKVNSQVCEQTFNFFNKFTQVKGMNHHRFRLFFVYMIDLHNLKISDKLHTTHPKQLKLPPVDKNADLCSALNELTITIDDEKEEEKKKTTTCPICGKNDFGLKNPKSGLNRHMKSAHKNEIQVPDGAIKCPQCPKICKNQSGLTRHQKVHQK